MMIAFRISLPLFLERGRDNTVSVEVHKNETLFEPTSGTFTLLDNNGDTVVSGSASVVDKVLTYEIDATDLPETLELSSKYVAVWAAVVEGAEYRARQWTHLCLFASIPKITPQDMIDLHYDLGGELRPKDPDFSLSRFIKQATGIIQRRLLNKGKRPQLIVNDESVLYEPLMWKSLELAFRDCETYATNPENQFGKLANFYAKKYEDEWPEKQLYYDGDETGKPGDVIEDMPETPVLDLSDTPRWF